MNGLRARLAPVWIFAILWMSYAYFWHSRDWNSASRLMLVYALGDHGSVSIDGYEMQTGDKAFFEGSYYSDKQPGYSLLALPPYLALRPLLRLPRHPVNELAIARWPADYAVTLATSGLATSLCGALLAWFSMRLGCGPRRALLVGLAYGLCTPAYVYATLAYGHQSAACCLMGAFLLVETAGREPRPPNRPLFGADSRLGLRMLAAGALAAYASVIELSVGPVSAVLGFFLLARVASRKLPVSAVVWFGLGAVGPTLVLLGYNLLVFGSPLDMGYAHHTIPRFRKVHSEGNPLGLRAPDWSKVGPLLIGRYRGLLWYAPVLWLAVPGWIALLIRKRYAASVVSMAVCLSVFLVNLSYPEWTGGWSTGPRLLVPMLPFAMVSVAGALGFFERRAWIVMAMAVFLALVGGVEILLFQGVGARIPDEVFGRPLDDPLVSVVWPLWRGDPVPPWWIGGRFTSTLSGWAFPEWVQSLGARDQWLQFLPLVGTQAVLIALAMWILKPSTPRTLTPTPVSGPAPAS